MTTGEVLPITEGVFFTTPASLPRGRHTLEREDIAATHRERVMIAMTELMAANGFDGVTIADIAARAAISRAAFYAVFDSKEACALAAYERFINVLLSSVSAALARQAPFADVLADVIAAYLSTLESDPVVGRAFQVEMDAVGPGARQWRRDSLELFAQALADRHRAEFGGRSKRDRLPHSAFLGGVYAIRQIASDALDTEPAPKLTALAPEVTSWLSRIYAT
ncbi:MAG: TetR/AcrR family transcriptional regulator [Marmoricola sp.]